MLKIVISGDEFYDEETNTFETVPDSVVCLEHSLLSISKWESKHQKPFLSNLDKSRDEVFDYIECMLLTTGVTVNDIKRWPNWALEEVNKYINSAQSATTFGAMPDKRGPSEVITSELIYYWLVVFNIPFTCETWHLNRLLSLIKIANVKNSKGKKMSKNELAQRNRELNEKRKRELGTRG